MKSVSAAASGAVGGRRASPALEGRTIGVLEARMTDTIATLFEREGAAVVRAPALQPHSLSTLDPAGAGTGAIEVADARAAPVEQNVARDEIRRKVRASLPRLPERERNVVARHFGLDGDEPVTTRQIARDLRTTEQQVRRVLECALGRLRMLLAPEESDETRLLAG